MTLTSSVTHTVQIRHGDFGDQFTVPMFEEKMAQLQDILSSPGEDGSAPLFPGANELPVLVVTNDESPELRANLKSIHWRHYVSTTYYVSVWSDLWSGTRSIARVQQRHKLNLFG